MTPIKGLIISNFIFAIFSSLHLVAEPSKPISSEVYFDVATSGGRPTICSIQFTLMYQDHTYKKGSVVGVTGSISWMGNKDNLGVMLKVIGSNLVSLSPASFNKFRIASASVNAENTNYQPNLKMQCEDKAAYCAIYPLESGMYFLEAVNNQTLSINYNRNDTGIDIVLPLEMKPDPKKDINFYSCVRDLAGKVKQ